MASLLISKRQWIATAKLLVFCGVIFSFVAACGDNKAATSGSTGDASASFNVHWNPGQTQSAGFSTLSLNCADQGIVTVLCYIYDEQETPLAYGGPWDCSDGGGTITRIPPGPQRTFVILGLDIHEQIVYQGQSAPIDLEPGDNNDAGTIVAFPFRPVQMAPADQAQMPPGPVSLTWQAVPNASEYRVLVAASSDFSDPIDIDAAQTAYTFDEYRSGPDYYWRVHAIDRYGNESAPSDPLRLFKTTGMWQYTYGEGKAHSVQVAPDGSYIVAGESQQSRRAFLLKVLRSGDIDWYREYIPESNGSEFSYSAAYSVQITADGGYILAGEAGTGTETALPYVAKIFPDGEPDGDSDGEVEWQYTYGGNDGNGRAFDIQLADDGYVAVGSGYSAGYMLKINADGTMEWEQPWTGGYEEAVFNAVQVVSDGYVVAGRTDGSNAYLGKTNRNATEIQEFGGSSANTASDVRMTTSDDGFIIAGTTSSAERGDDAYLIKTDATGNLSWESTFGGLYDDAAKAVGITHDGGFIIAGNTYLGPFGEGPSYVYLAKTNAEGDLVWDETVGVVGISSYANSLQVTPDNGFIIAGFAGSEVLLLKTDSNGNLE